MKRSVSSSAFLFCIDNKKKPEISYPTQFEHTIHVGFDPVTGEFTVRYKYENIVCLQAVGASENYTCPIIIYKPVLICSDMSRYFLLYTDQLFSRIFAK
jgi:hypothetical protein